MNKRQWIKLYMLEKNQMIQDITDMNLYDSDDYLWAENLPYKGICELYSELYLESTQYFTYVSDFYSSPFCPQCLIHAWCLDCSYGENHGICSEKDSEYQAIKYRISKSVGQLDKQYTRALKRFIKWNKVI